MKGELKTIREALEHGFHNNLSPRAEQYQKALAALSRLEAAAAPTSLSGFVCADDKDRAAIGEQVARDAVAAQQAAYERLRDCAVPELSREDVVRLAREAGFVLQRDEVAFLEMLQRFASLVRSGPVREVKPVAWVHRKHKHIIWHRPVDAEIANWKPLYTAPQPNISPGYKLVPLEALTRWRDAFAEELAAWDIDPPLHHVKTSHDEIVAMLDAAPQPGDKP